ncbi:hypothetical protein GCM10007415_25590 [Parapedobacter pyrenivorans]|uniref:Uncharacterized protein n=1 Tax=Parapedobacter pyrenivorans TaxID=1305674 RepID=A0A917HTQ1_9SPHI|nr:hypothetical protein GCM10007415_25590 [Parapedobacter pyrenivorans]
MCEDCFLSEHRSFLSCNEWLNFDLELTKKLGTGSMSFVKFRHDGIRDKDDGDYVYKCASCQQSWRLKEPDHALRGYFKKQ